MHKARALTTAMIMMLIMILVLTAVGADEFATEPKKAKISISSQPPAKETSQPPDVVQPLADSQQEISDIGSRLIGGAEKGVMPVCGDVNDDGNIDIGDLTFLVDYLYQGGDSPPMLEFADVDNCGSINAADIMYLIAYQYLGGPDPVCGGGGRLCYLPTGGNSVDLGCPITIDTPDGDSVAIPIYITNDTPIMALSLGFHHNSPDVEITSVSFDASVLSIEFARSWKVDPTNNEVLVYWHNMFSDLSPQSGGLLATMWAQVPVSTPSQTIDIDSAFIEPGVEFIFCPASGGMIPPAYNDCGTADIVIISSQLCGDLNDDSNIDFQDYSYLIDYMFHGGPAPIGSADMDECGSVNMGDAWYLIQHLWVAGDPPCEGSVTCESPTGGNSVDLGCPINIGVPDGDSVPIPVYITNSDTIRAASLGFTHNSPDIEITSVSFIGSMTSTEVGRGASIDPANNQVTIYWNSAYDQVRPQSGGLFATMWAQVPVSTPDQTVDIDTTFLGPATEFVFCPIRGGVLTPAYNDCGTAEIVIGGQEGEDIGSAIPITSLPFTDQRSTVNYIDDYYEFCPYEGEGAPDVVYSYQPAVPELVTISLCDDYTDYDTKLFVYAGDPSLPTACNDDASACTGLRSQIECQPLSPDTIYYIVVDGYQDNAGNYQIDMFVDDNCGPCEVTCPPGGVAEAEPCGDDANGGCNMTTPAFEPISPGETKCGTIWADGSRDTDWYELVLETECNVTWTGSAEFPVVIGFVDTSDCDYASTLDPYVEGDPCEVITCSRIAGPGTYLLFVSSQDYTGYPCGTDNDYWAEVQTTLLPSDYVRVGTDSIAAGTQGYELNFFWERTCPTPTDIMGIANGFEFSTTGAASFTFVDIIPFPEHYEWFLLGGLLFTNGFPDWFLVGGASMPPAGIPIFTERDYFTLVLDIGSGEGEICIDSAFVGAAGQWQWAGMTCGQGGAPDRPLFLASDSSNTQHPICITVYNPAICGDADGSGAVDIDDVVFLINYIFAGGPAPVPLESGDANCEGGIDIDDVVYLINYIFAGGPAPCDPDGDTVPDC